ncbi:MAG TPA: FAD-dependent oxidoreductase, partial [Thermoanaerobaculia bacterium]|nr:FAD-dependent oxidoreductase [Thermoanaerobaculia bacterium]
IESAAVFAEQLAGGDVDAAIAAYVQRRAPRTARITRESWKIGAAGQWEGRLSTAMRNLALRAVPQRIAERRMLQIIAG